MIVEYKVGSFLHEEYIVRHKIPCTDAEHSTQDKQWFQLPVKRKLHKKSEWSTLRTSKYL